MAKITIEELSNSLKEYLNGLGLTEAQVQELIDKMQEEVIGNKEELATSDKSNIVAAINELFQNANNGKQLIADAIGEPLSVDDTFSAMSTDINGLLSTFKTNMMNNGVTVESGDRFKQLIDKIASLADSGSKGFKFVEGTFTHYSRNEVFYYDIDLDFDPTIIISKIYHSTKVWTGAIQNGTTINIYNSLLTTNSYCCGWLDDEDNGQFVEYDTERSGNKFTFTTSVEDTRDFDTTFSEHKYWAIGVGEEDNTLRDSLAAILQEEGVSVSDEDDMATLIGKVDQEFDRQVVPAGTAVATDVLTGKTFINSTGSTITGSMANRGGAQTVTPGTSNKTLNSGYYSGNITVKGDANLVAANIVSGKSIFGVSGNAKTLKGKYEPFSWSKDSTQLTSSWQYKRINHSLGEIPSFIMFRAYHGATGYAYVDSINNINASTAATSTNTQPYNETYSYYISNVTSTSFDFYYKYDGSQYPTTTGTLRASDGIILA